MAKAAAAKTTAPRTEVSAPAVHTESKSKFVSVASKLPMHLELQLCKPHEQRVSGQHGHYSETIQVKHGEVYTIQGTAYPSGQTPKGFYGRGQRIEDEGGGYTITPNIPGDFMREWMRQNESTDMVKNGLIKIADNPEDMQANARDHATQDSGLGPLDPEPDVKDGPPRDRRMPKPPNSSLIKFGKADR